MVLKVYICRCMEDMAKNLPFLGQVFSVVALVMLGAVGSVANSS